MPSPKSRPTPRKASQPTALKLGDRVIFHEELERFPHFVVPKGTTGTITSIDPRGDALVKVDGEIPGLTDGTDGEGWQGEAQWMPSNGDEGPTPFRLLHDTDRVPPLASRRIVVPGRSHRGTQSWAFESAHRLCNTVLRVRIHRDAYDNQSALTVEAFSAPTRSWQPLLRRPISGSASQSIRYSQDDAPLDVFRRDEATLLAEAEALLTAALETDS